MTRAAILALVAAVVAWPAGQIRSDDQPADPLPEGSTWKGTLTQEGVGEGGVEDPVNYEVEFVVTRRRAKVFEAELREKSETRQVTYLVAGTVVPGKEEGTFKVEFESFESKDVGESTAAITRIPYTGIIKANKIKGEWKYPKNDRGVTLNGDFTLKLQE
jgi:hypothetical protein